MVYVGYKLAIYWEVTCRSRKISPVFCICICSNQIMRSYSVTSQWPQYLPILTTSSGPYSTWAHPWLHPWLHIFVEHASSSTFYLSCFSSPSTLPSSSPACVKSLSISVCATCLLLSLSLLFKYLSEHRQTAKIQELAPCQRKCALSDLFNLMPVLRSLSHFRPFCTTSPSETNVKRLQPFKNLYWVPPIIWRLMLLP